jgi:hypothetical protein
MSSQSLKKTTINSSEYFGFQLKTRAVTRRKMGGKQTEAGHGAVNKTIPLQKEVKSASKEQVVRQQNQCVRQHPLEVVPSLDECCWNHRDGAKELICSGLALLTAPGIYNITVNGR